MTIHCRIFVRPLSCLIASAFGFATALCAGAYAAESPQSAVRTVPQTPKQWFENGKRTVELNKAQRSNRGTAKNVILFVGDGMGVATVTAARILEGQQHGKDGEFNRLSFERLPFTAFSVTASANQQTADSAPTATALVTGVKVNDGAVSVDQTIEREEKDAQITSAKSLLTILERAEQQGLSTGIVTTARVTHATPASTYAHISERDWEADSDLPVGATVKDIARQLIEFPYGDGVDVVLGGGRAAFLPKTQADPEYALQTGRRNDGRDLTREWTGRFKNAAYVWNLNQFDALGTKSTKHLLGLFQPSHMHYEADRSLDASGEPSLAAMTAKAIEVLGNNKKGFFLMVEGGRIDHGHHAGNAYRALTDTIALSDAVKQAREMTSERDTLIIVTADHSHTLSITGYPSRGNPILGKATIDGRPLLDRDGLPYTTLQYSNGPGTVMGGKRREFDGATERVAEVPTPMQGRRPDLSNVDTTSPRYMQEALVPLGSETHGGEDVPIYASGPKAYLVHGALEQHVIYHVMAEALGFKN